MGSVLQFSLWPFGCLCIDDLMMLGCVYGFWVVDLCSKLERGVWVWVLVRRSMMEENQQIVTNEPVEFEK